MYGYLMNDDLSSDFSHLASGLALSNKTPRLLIVQKTSQGRSIPWLITRHFSPKKNELDLPFSLWISHELNPYPPTLAKYSPTPLAEWIFLNPPSAEDSFHAALEASQVGLFHTIWMQATALKQMAQWRRLQLSAEKTQTQMILFNPTNTPPWMRKFSFSPTKALYDETNSLFAYPQHCRTAS